MEKTNFEKLQVYKLSEKLADQIWKIVLHWDILAKQTVGKQLIRAADSVGANIAEGAAEELSRTFGGFCELHEDHFMRLNTGFAVHINAGS